MPNFGPVCAGQENPVGAYFMELPQTAGSESSDEALLRLYAKGDGRAAIRLVNRLTPMVFSRANRLLRDNAEAEDVTQEAMLRLWKMAPDWQADGARVSTWLYRVTSNLCLDRLRRKRGVALEEIAEPVDSRPEIDEMLQAKDRAGALRKALDLLPERQRHAVILRHLEGWTNPEIAAALSLSVEAVESLIARGKGRLKSLLIDRKAELGLEP